MPKDEGSKFERPDLQRGIDIFNKFKEIDLRQNLCKKIHGC
jgi:hypothetical protein